MISGALAGRTREKGGAETARDREIESEYNGEDWLGVTDVEAELARAEGAGVGNGSSRDERRRKRCERSGEQGCDIGAGQRKNRSRDERAKHWCGTHWRRS